MFENSAPTFQEGFSKAWTEKRAAPVDVMCLFTVVRIKTSNCFAALPKTVTPQAKQVFCIVLTTKKCLTLFLLISRLKFVVDHAAKPEIKKGNVDDWRSGMELLAQNQNVFCKM